MENEPINFFVEELDFEVSKELDIKNWLKQIIAHHKGNLAFINYIFCSDEYLHKINLEYLGHDTYTDIITFDYDEEVIESDIYISVERVKENAEELKIAFEEELHRVMAHGVLHLLGFGDKTPEEKQKMRELEGECLSYRKN